MIETEAGGVIRKELKCLDVKKRNIGYRWEEEADEKGVEMSLMSPHSRAKGVRLCN